MSMIAFIIYMIVGINYCLYRKHLKQSIILLKFGKFISPELLKDVVNNLTNKQMCGTNLEIIQGYFGNLSCGQYEIIPMKTMV